MHRRALLIAATALLGLQAWGQQDGPQEDKQLTFTFKDASVDAVLLMHLSGF